MFIDKWTDANNDLFAKFFLIDSSKNNREWATTDEANRRYARTAIGTPFTLMLNKEESKYRDWHPFLPDPDAPVKDQIDFAYRYAIGQIVDVSQDSERYKGAYGGIERVLDDNPWFATIKITDPTAKAEFQKPDSKLIPKAVSPGLIHLSGPDNAISEYHIVHLAAVPEAAYGPRAIKWASCNGDALSCIPKLKMASSYKERTNHCPLECLSSLAQKSGSSDIIMSAVNNTVTPGPQSFGSGTVETSQPPTNQMPTKPTIRIRRMNKSSEENPNGTEQEKPEGNNGEQTDANLNPGPQDRSSPLYGKIQQLEKQVQDNTQRWEQREKQYEVEKIIPRELFVDAKNRFNQRAWETEVQNAMRESASIEHLTRYYQLQLAVKRMPELTVPGAGAKRASNAKGASSQNYDEEDNERKMKLQQLGKLIRGLT